MLDTAALPDSAARLRALLHAGGKVVAFTGAGISTEAGIPDFRSPGGLWSRFKPVTYAEFRSSPDMRRRAWRNKFAVDDELAGAAPTRTHRALAGLVAEGRIGHIVTQNIDNLHQASGVAAERIVELHGNGSYAACLDCAKRYELRPLRQRFAASGEPPECEACGGHVKSATILFGQPMPKAALGRARRLAENADLFLVLGSSLKVMPAAALPVLARRNGARLAIVNREPTRFDKLAELVVRADVGDLFEPFLAA
jgi:NAD-dependent deacetylase